MSQSAVKGKNGYGTLILLGCILLLAAGLSLLIGRYPAVQISSPAFIAGDELLTKLVLNLRFPRILIAILLGMSLSAAGLVFQMIFGNPLVEPGFLGVSQGASFGAAMAIIFLGSTAWMVQTSATIFAILGLGFSYYLAHRLRYGGWVLRLVLAGIAVSALFSSGVGLLKYMADPLSQLPEITFWLLGGLSSSTWNQLLSILPAVSISLIVLILLRWRLNLLSLSDAAAFSMGASPRLERGILLGAAVLATASVISVSGMVTWVGLIVPHVARRLFGADSRLTLPAAMLVGGLFTLICDDLARILLPGEIPLGIITSLLGRGKFHHPAIHDRRTEPAMSEPILSLRNISYCYDGNHRNALKGLNLDIKNGSVTAILGPNGAGKSTLLHVILGWLRPSEGSIWMNGRHLKEYTRREAGQMMALVPQIEHMPFDYSVLEYVLLGRTPYLHPLESPRENDLHAAYHALKISGLSEMENRTVTSLSGGERQLVLLARALDPAAADHLAG